MQNWTKPYISPMNPKPSDLNKDWRVRFNYFHDNTWKRIRIAGGINRIHNFKDRIKKAELTLAIITERLESGWNPLTGSFLQDEKTTVDSEIEGVQRKGCNEALDFAFETKKPDWSKRTIHTYGSMLTYFKQAAGVLGISQKRMSSFELPHFKLLLDEVRRLRSLSPNGYNKYRDFLGTLVKELIQYQIFAINVIHHIPLKKEVKRDYHRPPTQQELNLIISEIKTVYPEYYLFLCVEYGCTLRPAEILSLRVKDYSREKSVFVLDAKDAKNRTTRRVVIPTWLNNMLHGMNLTAYPLDYYIFSTRNKYASFLPGPKRASSNLPHTTWKRIVKDQLGLEITQYSLKKLAGDDMVRIQVEAGLNNLLELPRLQMGHANQRQTAVYVKEHHKVLQDLIKNNMPMLE